MSGSRIFESWSQLKSGAVLPEACLAVTPLTAVLVPVSTWDLFPGHHSPEYARGQGQRDMYLNTIALQGVADRAVTDHLPIDAWISRRRIAMIGSVYPGDVLRGSAEIVAVRSGAPGQVEADFRFLMSTQSGPVLRVEITTKRRQVDDAYVSCPTPAAGHHVKESAP